jgi:2-dehydro-3-deoxy-D-arabinonate dehydratase
MQICRFFVPERGVRLGRWVENRVFDLTASGQPAFDSLSSLLQSSVTTPLPQLLSEIDLTPLPHYDLEGLLRQPDHRAAHLLPPVDRQEVWAAGVTYAWSREARVREARAKEVYVRVYDADRPELFFKSLGEKVVGPRDWIGIRGDSAWDVPEPELALVLNPALQVVGYTIGNDVSSRDIEGENPLYLPQAKMYRHACALGPAIRLADAGIDPTRLEIQMTILREEAPAFAGVASTAQIHRSLEGLTAYLGRYNGFPQGVVLLTGTGIVPGDDFTLQEGDEVVIQIEGIGLLSNRVRQL